MFIQIATNDSKWQNAVRQENSSEPHETRGTLVKTQTPDRDSQHAEYLHLAGPNEAAAPSPPYQPNQLLSVLQVCEEYGLGRTTLYEALGTGALPAKVVGKRGTRVRRVDVDNWIRSLPTYRRPQKR